MACHSMFPRCRLAILKIDGVDCIDGTRQENKARHMHVQELLERSRVPEID